jgi:HEAT repeat protein
MLDTLSRRTPSSTEKQAVYLAAAASHPDGAQFVHRQNVIHWLARAGDPDLGTAELASLLQTNEPEVLKVLATAVGPVKRALQEGDESVRTWAAQMLYRYNDSDVPTLLQPALQDTAATVRNLAALRLYGLGAAPLPPRDVLLQLLTDADSNVRIAAIDALIALGDTSVVDALIPRLTDPDPDVSFKAAYALGRLGDPRALAPLLQMRETDRRTTHSGVKLRQTAARAIMRISKRQA